MNKKLFISVIAICLICFSPRSLIYAKSYKFYETILFYSDNYTQVEVCCSYDYSDGNWACSIIDSANAGQISAGYKAVKGQNIAGGRDTVESISKQYFYIIDGNENNKRTCCNVICGRSSYFILFYSDNFLFLIFCGDVIHNMQKYETMIL